MRKLADFLRAYCARRARSHPRWKHISFLLSDATVPGEGEHKIISYVRALRQQEGYDPATQHCIVGEDADLIMLSLALHEENFLVLRKRMKWEAPECDEPGRESDPAPPREPGRLPARLEPGRLGARRPACRPGAGRASSRRACGLRRRFGRRSETKASVFRRVILARLLDRERLE